MKKVLTLLYVLALVGVTGVAVFALRYGSQQRQLAEEAAQKLAAAEQERDAAAEQSAALQQELEDARQQAAEETARLTEELEAARQLAAQRAEMAQIKEAVQYGDRIGTIWVEGTGVNCGLYWGDTSRIFDVGAGCSADNGCVMPGENGTVFIGAHTGSWFSDLKSTQLGAIIHLDTLWGDFQYCVNEMKVIYDTEADQCRWGASQPSCILYTCYPFGILTPTNRRYLVYADPVQTNEDGVVPVYDDDTAV